MASPCGREDTWQQEADRVAALLHGHAGNVVAEIGAGYGKRQFVTVNVTVPRVVLRLAVSVAMAVSV